MLTSVIYPVFTDQTEDAAPSPCSRSAGLFLPGSHAAMRPPLCSVSNTKQKKMDPEEEEELSISMAKITDDLVVEILSRLPFKSFCRYKCVCKSWLAFSSDPHYSQKLPKVPTGFFYQDGENSAVQFVSLSKNDEGIDGTLSFLPHYEQLKFIDCCNGLVLCEYRSNNTSPDILSFIVCNPATLEWRILPDIQRKSDTNFSYKTMLGFDPSRSPHFCVFNFHEDHDPANLYNGTRTVEMFSSRNSMWLVYSDLWDPENFEISVCSYRPHVFRYGFLYAHSDRDVLVLKELEAENMGVPPRNWTIKLPLHRYGCFADRCLSGCLGQFDGFLYYAVPEKDGCTVLIWIYYPDGSPFDWTVVHSLSMRDAFGRDDLVHYDDFHLWTCDYEIIAFDLERDVLFLIDEKANKLLSFCISTGKLNEIKHRSHWYAYCTVYYVACYLKMPDL